MRDSDKITRKMLSIIRESKNLILEEENKDENYVLRKNDAQFGDVRTSQEETFIKTVGQQVVFGENALMYIPSERNLKFFGEIPSLNLSFEFNLNAKDGNEGCKISVGSTTLSNDNYKTIGKIKDAYTNWKNSLIEDGDLMEKLYQAVTKD